MKTVIKTVKQHSLEVKNIDELKAIAEKYTTVKNYTYSRYSGINSILILNSYRKEIRDIWVKLVSPVSGTYRRGIGRWLLMKQYPILKQNGQIQK